MLSIDHKSLTGVQSEKEKKEKERKRRKRTGKARLTLLSGSSNVSRESRI
jgi:hypothetical protein